jgi:hypothetical protein
MKEVFGNYKDIMRRVPDLSKAFKLLSYKPKISMEEAIRRTIRIKRNEIQQKFPMPDSEFAGNHERINAIAL